jgi:hypothetical protein
VPEQYDEFNKCRDMLPSSWDRRPHRHAAGLEADDIIAYLAQKLPSCVIVSTDGDMQQCISDKAHVFYDGELDKQRYLVGIFPTRYTTLYKALVGDASDNIKGAKGFGDAAFRDLYCLWGDEGCDEMTELIEQRRLEELHEDVPQLKALQRVIDDRDNVYRSWALAQMYPDKINGWRRPLQWTPGVVKPFHDATHPAVAQWCLKKKIVHADNFEGSMEFFREALAASEKVTLDIETSGCDEGDEWLLRKLKKSADPDDPGVDVFGADLTSVGITLRRQRPIRLLFHGRPRDRAGRVEPHEAAHRRDADGHPAREADRRAPRLIRAFRSGARSRPVHARQRRARLPAECDRHPHHGELRERERRSGLEGALGGAPRLHAGHVQGSDAGPAHEPADGARGARLRSRRRDLHRGALQLDEDRPRDRGHVGRHAAVEQDAAYLGASAFNRGARISMERVLELEREDKEAHEQGWAVVRQYLIDNGWEGSVCPQLTPDTGITPAFIKQAHLIVTGEVLDTQVRTLLKLVAMIEAGGHDLLGAALRAAIIDLNQEPINSLLKMHFKGEPEFNTDSPPQKARFMYEVLKLPVRIRGDVTDKMRAAGVKEGNPKANDLAMQWAIQDDLKPGTREYDVLRGLQLMCTAHTKQKLYYTPYRNFPHWKDGLVHSTLNQCGPVTRRYSSSGPNIQQLPKHQKAAGEPPKFRQVFIPHREDAVVVSIDFSGQELRIIADESGDQNMLDCFVGENKKDMHSLTSAGILKKMALYGRGEQLWGMGGFPGAANDEFIGRVQSWREVDYEGFLRLKTDPLAEGVFKALRALGKKTNFTTEYGAQKKKLSQTLLVSEVDAQDYLEARQAAFPRAEEWKREVTEEFHRLGYGTTMLGARRHLGDALRADNKWEIGAAERQAVNFRVQGSAAEQTKLAMGRVWRAGLVYRYDANFIGPVHDELVFSVAVKDLVAFITELHAIMTMPYAGMTVPIVGSISFGLNYGEQIEVGETVDVQKINDVLYNGWMERDKSYAPLFPKMQMAA